MDRPRFLYSYMLSIAKSRRLEPHRGPLTVGSSIFALRYDQSLAKNEQPFIICYKYVFAQYR